ncbi:hypothetical protein FB446DRAFT_795242 [Lentinula raphanica]|nr:hypothetical protein FB446DRAFT_795242 [Lentinula raphanica]
MGLGAIIPVCMVEGTTFAQSAEGNIERLTLVTAKSNTLLEEPRRSGVARRVRKAPVRPELLTVPSLRPPLTLSTSIPPLLLPRHFPISNLTDPSLCQSFNDAFNAHIPVSTFWPLHTAANEAGFGFSSPAMITSLTTSKLHRDDSSAAILGIVLWAGLEVTHVARKRNVAADILYRLLIGDFRLCFPYYRVRKFDPPRDPAGAMETVLLNLLEG